MIHWLDIVIIVLVAIFLVSIIYFRWIKKNPSGLGCHCYKRNSCNLKLDELRDIVLNGNNTENE